MRSEKMVVFTCILQLLLGLVSLVVPTVVAVHLLSAKGRDAASAATARYLLQYFLLLCCLEQLLQSFPVAAVLRLLPTSLLLMVKLAVATALAMPALSLPPKISSFCLSHYDEYFTAALAAAEEKVLKPIKENVERALDAAKQRSQ